MDSRAFRTTFRTFQTESQSFREFIQNDFEPFELEKRVPLGLVRPGELVGPRILHASIRTAGTFCGHVLLLCSLREHGLATSDNNDDGM